LKALKEKNQNLSDTQNEEKIDPIDACDVCNGELYFNSTTTMRIGIMDKTRDVVAWVCPYCNSEFNLDDGVVELMRGEIHGEA
jgi:uncharacterized protein with PIN domain